MSVGRRWWHRARRAWGRFIITSSAVTAAEIWWLWERRRAVGIWRIAMPFKTRNCCYLMWIVRWGWSSGLEEMSSIGSTQSFQVLIQFFRIFLGGLIVRGFSYFGGKKRWFFRLWFHFFSFGVKPSFCYSGVYTISSPDCFFFFYCLSDLDLSLSSYLRVSLFRLCMERSRLYFLALSKK